jgi:hypothetical protein
MNAGKLLIAQLMDFVRWSSFARRVSSCGGDRRVRSLACAEQHRAVGGWPTHCAFVNFPGLEH